jgi:hypothetical protein
MLRRRLRTRRATAHTGRDRARRLPGSYPRRGLWPCWRRSSDKLFTNTNVQSSRVYLSGLIEPMSQIQDIGLFSAGRVAMTHETAHISTTITRSTSAREGSQLPFDGPIGRRWRAHLTSVGEPAPDAASQKVLDVYMDAQSAGLPDAESFQHQQ